MNSRIPLLALGACLWLQSCDSQIAGTNNETHTKGTFFQPDGQPAVGARVRVFQAANDSQPVWQTVSTPEPFQNFSSVPPPFCFWQGKLVVLGAQGIHIATIR